MTQDPDPLLAALLEVETAVWEALKRGDAGADAAALSDDFLGVYPDGFAGKADHTGQLEGGPTVLSYRLSDMHTRAFGDDHALLAYRADYRRAAAAEEEAMFVSSIWRRTETGWINVFSQDTPFDPDKVVP